MEEEVVDMAVGELIMVELWEEECMHPLPDIAAHQCTIILLLYITHHQCTTPHRCTTTLQRIRHNRVDHL